MKSYIPKRMAYRLDDWLVGGDDKIIFSVYRILDSASRIKYIGCTSCDIESRLYAHIYAGGINSNYFKGGNYYKFFNAVKNKKTTASIELIQEFNNPFEASYLETKLICEYLPPLNTNIFASIAKKESVYKYMWIKERGGEALLNKFRERAKKRHAEYLYQKKFDYLKWVENNNLTLEVAKK